MKRWVIVLAVGSVLYGVQPVRAQVSPSKGVGPVSSVKIGALDTKLASSGRAVFGAKCAACHKMEERYVGPALKGVTLRRTPEWIMNMILNPGQMVQEDEVAMELLAEYMAPMASQNLTQDEARSVLELFREYDAGKAPVIPAKAKGVEKKEKKNAV